MKNGHITKTATQDMTTATPDDMKMTESEQPFDFNRAASTIRILNILGCSADDKRQHGSRRFRFPEPEVIKSMVKTVK